MPQGAYTFERRKRFQRSSNSTLRRENLLNVALDELGLSWHTQVESKSKPYNEVRVVRLRVVRGEDEPDRGDCRIEFADGSLLWLKSLGEPMRGEDLWQLIRQFPKPLQRRDSAYADFIDKLRDATIHNRPTVVCWGNATPLEFRRQLLIAFLIVSGLVLMPWALFAVSPTSTGMAAWAAFVICFGCIIVVDGRPRRVDWEGVPDQYLP